MEVDHCTHAMHLSVSHEVDCPKFLKHMLTGNLHLTRVLLLGFIFGQHSTFVCTQTFVLMTTSYMGATARAHSGLMHIIRGTKGT
jgi:hypothetical protein